MCGIFCYLGNEIIKNRELLINNSNKINKRGPDNTKNLDNNQRPPHLVEWEQRSMRRFIEKWGRLPVEDGETFVAPIYGTENPNRMEWPFNG